MAVISAYGLPETIYTIEDGYFRDRTNLLSDFRPNETGKGFLTSAQLIGDLFNNEIVSNSISMNSKSVNALVVFGLEDDWFNRIHIVPKEIALGAVVAYREKTFSVWNSYLEANPLYDISQSQADAGITIGGDTATTFNRLEDRELILEVAEDGSGTINDVLSFNFVAGLATLTVTGVRVLYLPLWPQGTEVDTLTPVTWIFTAKDGTEQRSRSRARPNRKIDQEYLCTIDEWRPIQNIIYSGVGGRWAVASAQQAELQKGASYTAGDTTITLRTDNAEYYVGGLVVIWKSASEYHIDTVGAVDSNSIELETGFAANISGDLLIAPAFVGKGSGDIPITSDSAGNQKIRMGYEIYEGHPDLFGQVEDEYYNNYAVIRRENEGKNVSQNVINTQYSVASEFGLAAWGGKWTVPKVKQPYKWTFNTSDELWWFRLFLHEHQGNVPFWCPSFQEDLVLSSDVGAGATLLSITDDEYRTGGSTFKDYIRIIYPDGSEDLRNVVSVADAGGGVSVLTIDQATSNVDTIAAADIEIQFLRLMRFDGAVTIKGYGYKSTAEFALVEVKQ